MWEIKKKVVKEIRNFEIDWKSIFKTKAYVKLVQNQCIFIIHKRQIQNSAPKRQFYQSFYGLGMDFG